MTKKRTDRRSRTTHKKYFEYKPEVSKEMAIKIIRRFKWQQLRKDFEDIKRLRIAA